MTPTHLILLLQNLATCGERNAEDQRGARGTCSWFLRYYVVEPLQCSTRVGTTNHQGLTSSYLVWTGAEPRFCSSPTRWPGIVLREINSLGVYDDMAFVVAAKVGLAAG